MFLVKPCASCGRKIRFPIDRGKIKVNCPCGAVFLADPDDPGLYSGGKIDPVIKKEKGPADSIADKILSFDFNRAKVKLINSFYEYKYRVQNFPLLPAKEKAVILLQMACLSLVVIYIAAVLFFL